MSVARRFIPLAVALVLAGAWLYFGGLPFAASYDKYGALYFTEGGGAQSERVSLPGGDAYIYYVGDGPGELNGEVTPDLEVPRGLKVEVRRRGSKALPQEEAPGWLAGSEGPEGSAWEPLGKVDAGKGSYELVAESPTKGGGVSLGGGPVNPLGAPIIGALIIVAIGGGMTLLDLLRSRR